MTDQLPAEITIHNGRSSTQLRIGAWVRANAVGLGLTFALFGLVGEGMEAMGAEHDTAAWGVPTLAAMVLGGTAFAALRGRVLGVHHRGPRWHLVAIGAGSTAGFVAGLVPPLDFLTGILAAGTIGGAVQLRRLRRQAGRTRRSTLVGVGGWLLGGLAAVAAAILVADVILTGMLDLADEVNGVGGFVAILALVGLVGGAVGGAIEGGALRRGLARAGDQDDG